MPKDDGDLPLRHDWNIIDSANELGKQACCDVHHSFKELHFVFDSFPWSMGKRSKSTHTRPEGRTHRMCCTSATPVWKKKFTSETVE